MSAKGKECMKEIKIDLPDDALRGLFEGKRLEYVFHGGISSDEEVTRILIYPARYGVFMTVEKFAEIERLAMARAYQELLDIFESAQKDNKYSIN